MTSRTINESTGNVFAINQDNRSLAPDTRYAIESAQGYFERGEKRSKNGYEAIGLLDLIVAQAFVNASESMNTESKEKIDQESVTVEMELATDRLNKLTNRLESGPEIPVLNIAKLEIGDGNAMFNDYGMHGNLEDLTRAYAHYRTAHSLMDTTVNFKSSLHL